MAVTVRSNVRFVLCDTQQDADDYMAQNVRSGEVVIVGTGEVPISVDALGVISSSARHLAIGINTGSVTAAFESSRVAVVDISAFGFTRPPMVTLTPNDSGTMPVYKTDVTPTRVTVRLKTNWTGTIDVGVQER